MTQLALLLLLASVGHGLSRWTRLPVIPLLLALGMLGSFSGLIPHPGEGKDLAAQEDPLFFVLELGLVFVVFVSGLELAPRRFRHHRGSVLWIGLTQFFVMGAVGFGLAQLLNLSVLESIYVGCAVSASSTVLVLRQLRTTQQAVEPQGRMLIGVLLLQDVMALGLLITLSTLGMKEEGAWIQVLLTAGAMGVAAWWLQRSGAERLLRWCEGDEELILLLTLALLFAFLGGAYAGGVPVIAGAFLAGYSLSSFPVTGWVSAPMQSLSEFFRSVLFVALGGLLTLPSLGTVGQALLLAFSMWLLTPPLVAWLMERVGWTSRPSIESGLLLAQTSEFSIILALAGLRMTHLSDETFTVIVLMAVVTMSATPFLARESVIRQLLHWHPGRRRRRSEPRKKPALTNHQVLLLGFGTSGMSLYRAMQAKGWSVLVIDDDPAVISELTKRKISCLRGDAADGHTLEQANVDQASLIVVTTRRAEDALTVLRQTAGVRVLARVFDDGDAERIRALGGVPVSGAEAATEAFERWWADSGSTSEV